MCSAFLSSKIPLLKLCGHRNVSRVVLAVWATAPVLAGEDCAAVVVAQVGRRGRGLAVTARWQDAGCSPGVLAVFRGQVK
jgi:hypothetical protein